MQGYIEKFLNHHGLSDYPILHPASCILHHFCCGLWIIDHGLFYLVSSIQITEPISPFKNAIP